jgi:hypothetical protein
MSSHPTLHTCHLHIHVRQGLVVEDSGRRIAHLLHGQTNAAGFLVHALGAPHVRRLTDARDSGERPLEHAYHLAKRDVGGWAAQEVASTLAFLAFDDTVALELEKNRLEKLPGDRFSSSNVGHENRPAAGFAPQDQKRLEAIL